MPARTKYACHCCDKPMTIEAYMEWNPEWRLMPNGKDVECRNCQSDPHTHDEVKHGKA